MSRLFRPFWTFLLQVGMLIEHKQHLLLMDIMQNVWQMLGVWCLGWDARTPCYPAAAECGPRQLLLLGTVHMLNA
jgi:hypothetical protein